MVFQKRQSSWNKGISPSLETRKKQSLAHKGQIGIWKGKHLSEETKLKLSLAHKGNKISKSARQKISFALRKIIDWKVNDDGCHICISHSKNKQGYPQIMRDGKHQRMNRYVYEQNFGKIPQGMVIRHSCDNRACINPKHLLLGTQKDNIQDAIRRDRNAKGEMIGSAKLSREEVLEIFNSKKKNVDLAKKYGVSAMAISYIQNKINWKQITKEE
jgi:hypothetical protein